MRPVTLVLIAAIVSIAGTWSKKQTISSRQVIGIGMLTFIFIIFAQMNDKFAEQFGWLLVAATVGAYGDELFTAVGNATAKGANGSEPK